ncbi:MAG TPA: cyclic-di-AMP receptor [Tissierellales bacterium]|nr:cyclic-di-AMP receptor [Tissierellales bacterium]
MKLVIAIIQDQDVQQLVKELMSKKYRATKLASTGGFLKSGNTTLLIGVEEEKIDDVISIIEGVCKSRNAVTDDSDVVVGGANIFIIDIDKFVNM